MIVRLGVLLLAFAGGTFAGPILYSLTYIGTLNGTETRPYGINDAGDVVGVTYSADGQSFGAFLYRNGVLATLPQLSGSQLSEARGISNSGWIGGWYVPSTPGAFTRAFLIDPNGNLVDLGGTLGYSLGLAMNRQGTLVGSGDGPGNQGVFRHDPATATTTWLPDMGGDFGWSDGINTAGTVVGFQRTSPGNSAPVSGFYYEGNTLTPLGTFGGQTIASRINSTGEIVGYSELSPGGLRRAFRFLGGTMTPLPWNSTWQETLAFAISEDGRVITGSGYDTNGNKRAIVWIDGTLYDLNDLVPPGSGWLLQSAGSINASGQIAGYGLLDGIVQAYRLEPLEASIPEPGTFALATAAACLLWVMRVRSPHGR